MPGLRCKGIAKVAQAGHQRAHDHKAADAVFGKELSIDHNGHGGKGGGEGGVEREDTAFDAEPFADRLGKNAGAVAEKAQRHADGQGAAQHHKPSVKDARTPWLFHGNSPFRGSTPFLTKRGAHARRSSRGASYHDELIVADRKGLCKDPEPGFVRVRTKCFM